MESTLDRLYVAREHAIPKFLEDLKTGAWREGVKKRVLGVWGLVLVGLAIAAIIMWAMGNDYWWLPLLTIVLIIGFFVYRRLSRKTEGYISLIEGVKKDGESVRMHLKREREGALKRNAGIFDDDRKKALGE